MQERVDQLLDELDRQVEKVAETQDFVTSLTLTLGEIKRKLAEIQHWATLAIIQELGGYQPGDPVSSVNEKVLGGNAETRERTLVLELSRPREDIPEDIARYRNYRGRVEQLEEDLAYQQDELKKWQDKVSATKWKLRVYLADKLADTEISREVLPF